MSSVHFSLSSMALILLLALASLLVSPTISTSRHTLHHSNAKTGFQVTLKQLDSGGNFTKSELLQRAIKRGRKRMERLHAMALAGSDVSIEAPIHAGVGEFLMDLSIGTPPLSYSAILDTGSDLTWTQCQHCFKQPTPIFDPKNSSSYSTLPCSSNLCKALPMSSCSDDNCDRGILATETFTFENVSVPKVGFGCGFDNEGITEGAGLVGLGRGPMSLVSQLDEPKFSFCLTSLDSNKTSTLLMGSRAGVNTGFNQNHPFDPIKIFLLWGMIIDSGTRITLLEESAFDQVKIEFIRQIKLAPIDEDLQLCFNLPSDVQSIKVPKFIFHFEGADLDLPPENYFITTDSGVGCLAMGSFFGISIFGNFQQQNTLVVYDLAKETISFLPTQCDQL
ncbi:hypothetical protein Pfo_008249 [Paulownia fortunei]|nr:hypothetical protein Pfo_008249 [Paulownia fortunei]